MTIALLALVGLVLGILTERLVDRGNGEPAAPSVNSPAVPDARPHRRRRPKRIAAWIAVGAVVLLIAGTVGGYLWANAVFDRIEKVDVSAQLSPTSGGGTNYLLVGSDNGREDGEQREGIDGNRSDTIMILRVEGGDAKMLSLPRDLWVANPATGENGRLNATYNAGPANLVQAVTENFDLPVNRYIEIDFLSFAGLVDAFGGIDIFFENPSFDLASGLDVKTAGLVHLDGDQALAYVRSRRFAEVIDGEPVLQGGLPDVNRTERQQEFLRAVTAKAGSSRNPLTLMSAADKMSTGLRVDDDMTLWNAMRFAFDMRRTDPVSIPLPVTPRTTSGGAAVLDLDQPAADAVLAQFR